MAVAGGPGRNLDCENTWMNQELFKEHEKIEFEVDRGAGLPNWDL